MMPKHFHTNDEVNPSDFKRVCFDHSHSFQHDELVLVSRSKGGFSYGYVDTMCSEMKCPYNYQYQHNALYWKVWLYRSETKRVYKVLSAFKIGKLSKVDSIPNKDETELTPDEYKQVLYDEETVLSSTSVVCPSTSGGLVHCIVVGPQALKCHCFDHQIDGLSVDYGTTTSVLPLSAVGVILSPENQKKIVIDGANIAYSNSNGKVFEVGVLKSVITYYEKRKYQVTTIISNTFTESPKKMETVDKMDELKELVIQNKVSLAPACDYDDSYCINFAIHNKAVILSNDKYRDHLEKIQLTVKRNERKRWIDNHRISFMFIQEKFIPNPDFKYPFQ